MADIYSDDGTKGVVDIDKASRLLATVGGMADVTRKAYVSEITAAALLDIALSLRVVAAEAETALYGIPPEMLDAPAVDVPDLGGSVPDFLVEGDLVAVAGETEPGEIRDFRFTEGERFADVVFANGVGKLVPVSALERLRGDARDDDAMQAAAESTIDTLRALNAEADGEPDLDETDVDEDFEPALDPLAALAEREAERKGKKKGGKR